MSGDKEQEAENRKTGIGQQATRTTQPKGQKRL